MRKKPTMALTVLLLGGMFLAGVRAEARPGREGKEEGRGRMGDRGPGSKDWAKKRKERFEKMKKDLGLSQKQEQELEAHKEKHRKEAQALREELRAKREAMKAELDKPSLDEARVTALNEELKVLQGKLADQRLRGILEVRKILTPEQFKKFHEHVRGPRGDGPGHERGGRRGGPGEPAPEDFPEPPPELPGE